MKQTDYKALLIKYMRHIEATTMTNHLLIKSIWLNNDQSNQLQQMLNSSDEILSATIEGDDDEG